MTGVGKISGEHLKAEASRPQNAESEVSRLPMLTGNHRPSQPMVMSPDHLDLSSMLTEFERPLNESERERLLASLPRNEVVEDGIVS